MQELKLKQDVEVIWDRMQALKERMDLVEELNSCFKSQAEDIKRETNTFFDELVKFKKKFSEDLMRFQRDMNNDFLVVKDYARTIEEKTKHNKGTIDNHNEELKRLDFITQTFRKSFSELYDSSQKLTENKLELSYFQLELGKLIKDIQEVKYLNEDLTNTVRGTDNYLEKYIPFRMQNMITETMNNVLPKSDLHKLHEFAARKYLQLKEVVADDDGVPRFSKVFFRIPKF